MATITKRGKKWAVRIRMQGVSLSKSFLTKGQAQAWSTQTESAILTGSYDSPSEKTLGDAIDRYLREETPKKKSHINETAHLNMIRRQSICDPKLSHLTTEMLAKWRDEMSVRVQSSTARRYLTIVNSVLETCRKEWKWIAANPMKDVKKPAMNRPRDRIFTDEEVERFCDLMGGRPGTTYLQQSIIDCFLFALETGMRAGEITGLEWQDIECRVATLHDTKNGDKRKVPLSLEALRILDSRRIFSKPFGIKTRSLTTMFHHYMKYSGIDGATFHDTRHTAVTRLAKKLQPFELAKMVGHRNLSQTLAYFSASAEDLADKLN